MFGMIRYAIVFGLIFLVISVVAIGWPRFTDQARPQALTAVETSVGNTPVGVRIREVLGVSDPASEPLDLRKTGETAALGLVETAKSRVRQVFVTWVARQLEAQRPYLTDPAYEEIRQVVCQVPESSPSAEASIR